VLALARADLERLLTPPAVIDALAAAFRLAATGGGHVPARVSVPASEDGVLLLMPAVTRGPSAEGPALGVKLVSIYAGNRGRGHPTVYASYLLMDGATGQPVALLEGTYLTALRTGATSALAARLLARADARRVVCFGAGVQAAMQLSCLAAVRPLERVAVVGRNPDRARRFAVETSRALGLPVEVASDARAAVRGADIVTCATTSPAPVVFGADLRPGVHLDLVGAFRPTEREADTEAVRRARVVVDTYAGALEEAGDVLLPLREGAIDRAHILAELAEVVTGARIGRRSDADITLFKSVGWALEDLAAARLAYDRARAERLGAEVAL
jgi:ornithine cyclodeaminase/alanine dehydrogenase-like protein (mu-crystallin family)